MNKADWKNAPEWANWYTEDVDGYFYWEFKPVWDPSNREYRPDPVSSRVQFMGKLMHQYIEQRPTEGV